MSKNKKSKQVATSPKKSGEEAFEETRQQALDRYKGEPEKQKTADEALGKTYMDWRNDFAFKFVFGSHSENMRVLLSDLLGFQVDSVNPAENEVPGVFVEGKIMRFDFTCTSGGRKFIVEMQNSITENLEKRVIAYVSAGVLSQVKRSENYEYDPVYEIIITDFKWTGISYGPITRFQLRDEDHHPMPSNLINVHVCNIAMVKDRPFEELGNPALEALHVLGNICNFAQLPEEFPDRYRKAALMSTIRKLEPDTIMGYISSVVSEEEKLSHGRAMYNLAKEEAEEEKHKAIEEAIEETRKEAEEERQKAIEETRKEAEGEKQKAIEEAKKEAACEERIRVVSMLRKLGHGVAEISSATGYTQDEVIEALEKLGETS